MSACPVEPGIFPWGRHVTDSSGRRDWKSGEKGSNKHDVFLPYSTALILPFEDDFYQIKVHPGGARVLSDKMKVDQVVPGLHLLDSQEMKIAH